jgi:hypothetical protein
VFANCKLSSSYKIKGFNPAQQKLCLKKSSATQQSNDERRVSKSQAIKSLKEAQEKLAKLEGRPEAISKLTSTALNDIVEDLEKAKVR